MYKDKRCVCTAKNVNYLIQIYINSVSGLTAAWLKKLIKKIQGFIKT